jgi:hypothetical protein
MSKRKKQSSSLNLRKRHKPNEFNPNDYNYVIDQNWVPASKTRNASLNDYCMDWFNMYNIRNIEDKPVKRTPREQKKVEKESFLSFLLSNGNEFEKKIVEMLKEKFPNDFIQICNGFQAKEISKYKDTLSAMKKDIPIIYQGVLHNTKNKSYGCPDLIVRTDFLQHIFNNVPILEENENWERDEKEKESKDEENPAYKYKYCIIDIKWSQIHFNANMSTIRNTLNVKPFKTQIILYNMALGEAFHRIGFQEDEKYPNYCYILGKSWLMERTINKEKVVYTAEDPFDYLGVIDIEDNDRAYIHTVNEALIWYRKLVSHGHKWSINPPSNKYLYPNMSNTLDGQYHKLKLDIADKFFEITNVWQCGVNHRENALNQEMCSWNDPDLDSEALGITGDYTKRIVDKILKVNRGEYKDIIYPKKFKTNKGNWKTSKLKLYVDFETISSIFFDSNVVARNRQPDYKEEKDGKEDKDTKNSRTYKDVLFMIGLASRNDDGLKVEKFILSDLTVENRRELVINFIKKINEIANANRWREKVLPIYHFGSFEKFTFSKTCKVLNINVNRESQYQFDFIDLNNVLKSETFAIKGALNYGLKSIVKAMNLNGITDLSYKSEEKGEEKDEKSVRINSGEDAMLFAWKYYTSQDRNKKIIDSIDRYNTIDCLALDEIMMKIMVDRK